MELKKISISTFLKGRITGAGICETDKKQGESVAALPPC
jgi:hypothetical protein